jgi:hypothetical protein
MRCDWPQKGGTDLIALLEYLPDNRSRAIERKDTEKNQAPPTEAIACDHPFPFSQ